MGLVAAQRKGLYYDESYRWMDGWLGVSGGMWIWTVIGVLVVVLLVVVIIKLVKK